ncbi:PAPA-1-like conserved region-domain-containing protein [Hypoxylon sp. FL1150]|nr:PAPA-1-like conserved region-domain-containing protein [Hypoxylon sp. FL1150]
MASRPRRAAAQRANTAITDMVDSDNHTNSRTGRTMSSRTSRRSEGKSAAASVSRGPPSSSASNQHVHFTVKLPASKLRQSTSSRPGQASRPQASNIVEGKRNRSQKKSYVVESSEDEDDDDDVEDEVQVEEDDDEDAEGDDDDDDMDMGEEDAEGEIVVDDTMDLDAEGDEDDEDAEGEDDDMDVDPIPPPAPVIKVSKPPAKSTPKSKAPIKLSAKAAAAQARDSDDDEELSDLESDADEIQDTVKVGGGDEEDAEGEDEEIEAANPAEDDDDDLGSDGDDGSRAETPDLTRMTKRQRARFEENGDALMKLSDEVQAKKHFTAEELSMRRAEMARRRRNLSEKRNEEVKMETINKLLKKQAPKISRKSMLGGDQTPDVDSQRANPVFVRWISNKDGSRTGVPDDMLTGPAGRVFVKGGLGRGKMVEEVS